MVEIWGGGSGGQGNTGGCAGGYTMLHVPLAQLPSSFTCNAPENNSSRNNGSGQPASISGVTGATGYAGSSVAAFSASQGTPGTPGSGYIMGPTSVSGGGKGGASALGIWGGAGSGSNANNPGGGAGTNGGNGGTLGGCTQVRITCW
jgi:hypothetical protein